MPHFTTHGVSIAGVALAWVLHQPRVTGVILGAKHADQLAQNIAATAITLSPEELEQLTRVSALPPEYPGWMFELQGKHRRTQIDAAKAPRVNRAAPAPQPTRRR